MISSNDLRSIELFSSMTPGEIQHFATKAADVRLEIGDLLVHEGERADFYVLLGGWVQGKKSIHGIQHDIVRYGPGDFFGELPNLLGMPSGISIRAETECRIARFEIQQLQELIQGWTPSSEKIFRKMSQRVLDAQQFVQTVPSERVVISATEDSRTCHRIRAFLTANRIPFNWQGPQSETACQQGNAEELTVLVDGVNRLTNPSSRELANALGFQTEPKHDKYDVVIVGAGPAGMAAGVYGASEGLKVLMIERETAGGQAGTSSRIENYLGFPAGISGDELSDRALKQAMRFGAEIAMARTVEAIAPQAGGYCVSLDEGTRVFSRSVLLATGVDWRRLEAPGLEDFLGRGVLYGASRTEAMKVSGKKIFLVGGGNSAGQAAMFFSDYADEIRLLVRGSGLALSMSQYLMNQLDTKRNITVEPYTQVTGVGGGNTLEYIVTSTDPPKQESFEQRRPADALFIMIGADANTGWLPAELERDKRGFIRTGRNLQQRTGKREPFPLETNLPGLFCAGDVRNESMKRVSSGVGEGSMAIAFIHQYLALSSG